MSDDGPVRTCAAFLLYIASLLVVGQSAASLARGQPPENTAPFFRGDRIMVRALINDQKAVLAFDTGAESSAVFESAARRFDILSEDKLTKPFDLAMFGAKARIRLPVVPIESSEGIDGVFAWANASAMRLLIDGYDRVVATPREPPQPEGWKRWKLKTDNLQAFFEVTEDEKPFGRVFLDTGATCGVRLRPDLWKAWRAENPKQGVTLETFRYALGDTTVHELAWADELRVGDFVLYDVPVSPLPEDEARQVGDDYVAMIGMAALRNLRVILDREGGEVWTQSVGPAMVHNRAGAVFVADQQGRLIAHVLEGGPAHAGGLLDGDILVSIDGKESSNEKEAFRPLLQPAGTQVNLVVERNGERTDVSVALKDLLP